MKHLFLPYELSLKAKEKGFDEPCFYFINEGGKLMKPISSDTYKNSQGDRITAPLYQQIVDWFRSNHKIQIQVLPYAKKEKQEWRYELIRMKISIWEQPVREGYNAYINNNDYLFESYYEALNKAIEEALKLI